MMAIKLSQLQLLREVTNFKKPLGKVIIQNTGKRWCSRYFLTTPIFYVNADPHLGHLYTSVIADAANRFQKMKNPKLKTNFMVGTDEHGLKVIQSAAAKKMDVKPFCDKVSNRYKEMFNLFDVEYDDFVRTTEERHIKAATALWNKIFSKNLIYSENYSGWYSIADEAFVTEQHLDPKIRSDGKRYTLKDQKEVFFLEEVNYKFKLQNFKNDLLHWLKDSVIRPKAFQAELIKQIEEEEILKDISVSRPAERVSWGIPVPGDPSQTMYVWFDALSSYLCTNGYPDSNFKWPPDVQIVGKDIIKFHAVFWPAFLMAADLEPPKYIFCHAHWLKDDEKMSKSKGNVVDPFQSSEQFTADGLRYFLLRGGVPQYDGNFSVPKVTAYLNAELGDNLGNLLLRCSGKKLNPNQVFPPLLKEYQEDADEMCSELMKALEDLPEKVTNHFEDFNFYRGIDDIVEVLRLVNRFFNERCPWKTDKSKNHVNLTLHLAMEGMRVCGILLHPIIPKTSTMLLNKLSVPVERRSLKDIRPYSWELPEEQRIKRNLSTETVKLFPKIVDSLKCSLRQ